MADSAQKPNSALFNVFLRLRPSFSPDAARFLDVERSASEHPTHITIRPPANDFRKRAVEKFEFTRVFQEDAAQLDLFRSVGLPETIEGVLGKDKSSGKDGLLATLGVTGSGKSHTILGSRSQRGLTQLSLEVLYKSLAPRLVDVEENDGILGTICDSDVSEAQLMSAGTFLELMYGDGGSSTRMSRATPRATTPLVDSSFLSIPGATSRKHIPRVSTLPQYPNVEDVNIECDQAAEYAVVISMYEVYNDRIFDLLSSSSTKSAVQKRRGLLFKSTEQSHDRKVVAGLRKVVCGNIDEALLVLESGLAERRVAGTGSNAVSSRSHGFFCVEVKKRSESSTASAWTSSTLTVVDLAGSERARAAKTTGSTLAEAGKINESLMYLGQCMQLQSDNADISKPLSIVPFRQCKLTELLFSNSFPSSTTSAAHPPLTMRRQAQKSVMIVTADPHGDFNATSQILRYSALAREVTVPRIPSVTASILSGATAAVCPKTYGHNSSGRTSPSGGAMAEDLDSALAEISRLREELEVAQHLAEDETRRRREAEAAWVAATERCDAIETEVREEVFGEMEARLGEEMLRWRAAADEERERDEARVDAKLDILARGIEVDVYEDPEPDAAARIEELERANEALRARLVAVEREKGLRSPSKKMRVLKTRKWEGSGIGFDGSP